MTVTDSSGNTLGSVGYSYNSSHNLTGVDANTDYTYTYNAFGTATGVKIGSAQLVSYNYSGIESGNYLNSITYGNGQAVYFTYDSDHNLTIVSGNGGSYKYIYDEVGNLSAIIDYANQTKTKYTYDADGNTTTTITNLNTGTVIHTYSSNDEQTSSTYENEEYYDDLDRISSSSFYAKAEDGTKTPVYSVKYGYTDHAGFLTSNQTSLMSITANNYSKTTLYEYDKIGNITKAGDVTYKYDSSGQLVRVNDPQYGTTVYVYDAGGNIKYVKSYDYTVGELGTVKDIKTYTYGNTSWKDLLTSYNGQSITYDAIGNPTNYLGSTLTWQMGRELASLTKDGTTYNYKYNYDGLRTYKSNGTNTYNYIWQDGKLISQTGAGNTIKFIYEGDKPTAINYNGEEYYYVTNLQGDIIAILDKNGNSVVEYTYDAWGKILSTTGTLATTLGQHNPLRYRGYCYDTETGFYYLQSRYYDPAVGRFINADEIGYLGANGTVPSYNLFAYCLNNPAMNSDYTGSAIETVLDIASAAWSLIDLITKPSWLNLVYFIWDVASAVIPFVPDSYIAKGGKFVLKIASKADDFTKGSKFLTGTYKKLKNVFKNIEGIEIHHLVEKRFKKLFRGCNVDNYLSIPLSKELHRTITNRWRNLHKTNRYFKYFKYGSNYTNITYTMMEKAIKEVYKDMPQLLDETLTWFRKNWRK